MTQEPRSLESNDRIRNPSLNQEARAGSLLLDRKPQNRELHVGDKVEVAQDHTEAAIGNLWQVPLTWRNPSPLS